MRRQQEPAGAGGRVGDRVGDRGAHAVDHRPDQRPRREVLTGPGLHVLRALGQQRLVGVALDVDVGGRPLLGVDEVVDEPLELGRVLDAVLRLAEDRPQRAGLVGQADEDLRVLDLELGAVGVEQPLPGQVVRDDLLGLELPTSPLVGHLKKQQVGQLLGVLQRPDPVVAQHVAVRPQLVHQATSVSHVAFLPTSRTTAPSSRNLDRADGAQSRVRLAKLWRTQGVRLYDGCARCAELREVDPRPVRNGRGARVLRCRETLNVIRGAQPQLTSRSLGAPS